VYGTGSLTWAINQANATPGTTDIICLTPDSTYTLTRFSITGAGLPNITSPIEIHGGGATITRDTDSSNFRLFNVTGSGNLTLENLVLTNGSALQGGAILSSGVLSAEAVVIQNNFATNFGGAIFISAGRLTLTNSQLVNNVSGGNGGGVYVTGGTGTLAVVNGTRIASNFATFNGGGIFNDNAQVSIFGSTFYEDVANQGGGLHNQPFGSVSIQQSFFLRNQATTRGGGILTESVNLTANNGCFISNISLSGSAAFSPSSLNPQVNVENNYWGQNTGPVPGQIVGAFDAVPFLTTVPLFCTVS
jgi:predicted outer membrane repeat protein